MGAGGDAIFNSTLFSLLDRGFIYAFAHVRGGGELGELWHKEGKLLKKKNSFNDFITCAEFLIKNQYTTPQKLGIEGGSAGGLLIGAVINARPDLFHAVHLAVPFVDVLNTMLDKSIPLTTLEYEEWGDPNEKLHYDYIKSYAPYENIRKMEYPHILMTTGLNDSNVPYWEPAKMTAKLRTHKTDNNWLLLKTDFSAGHGGPSKRDDMLKQQAFEYSFFLKSLGVR